MAEMETRSWRPFRIALALMILLLSVQAWTGDFVNVFVTTASTSGYSAASLFQGFVSQGPFLLWHALEGIAVLVAAILVFDISLRYHRRSVKIGAGLGLLLVAIAGIGGYFFVLSGFSNGVNSMQMGGAFIPCYAMYFITLYYTK